MFEKCKVLKKFLAIAGMILLTPVFGNAVHEQIIDCNNGMIKQDDLKAISNPSKGESNCIKITNCDISKEQLKIIIRRLKKIKARHFVCVDGYSNIKNFQKLDKKAGSNITVVGRQRRLELSSSHTSNKSFDCDKFSDFYFRNN